MGKKNNKRSKGKNDGSAKEESVASTSSTLPDVVPGKKANISPKIAPSTPPSSNLELLRILSKLDQICDDQEAWLNSPLSQLESAQSMIELLSRLQKNSLSENEKTVSVSKSTTDNNGIVNGGEGDTREEEWNVFWKWIDENAGFGSESQNETVTSMRKNVEVGWMGKESGNGCRAARDIAENEVFLRIPVDLMMSCEVGPLPATSPLPEFVTSNPILSTTSTMGLTLLVANEKMKGKGSFFYPYLSLLPSSFDVPMYWHHSDLALLSQCSPNLFRKACNGWRIACKHYCYIVSLVHGSKLSHVFYIPGLTLKQQQQQNEDGVNLNAAPTPLSFDLFKWALSAVVTRQNEVPTDTDSEGLKAALKEGSGETVSSKKATCLALIPLWDMCNHSSSKCSSQSFVKTQDLTSRENQGAVEAAAMQTSSCALECTAHIPYKKGQEINIFYGKRPSSEYFLYSGFVPTDNEEYDAYSNDFTWPLTTKTAFGGGDGGNGDMELLKVRMNLCHKLQLKLSRDKKGTYVQLTLPSLFFQQDEESITAEKIKQDFKKLFVSTIQAKQSVLDDNQVSNGDNSQSKKSETEYKKLLLALMASTCSFKDGQKWLSAIDSKTNHPTSAPAEDTNVTAGKESSDGASTEKMKGNNVDGDTLQLYFTYCMDVLMEAYESHLKTCEMAKKMVELKTLKLNKERKTISEAKAGSIGEGGGIISAGDGGGLNVQVADISIEELGTRLHHLSIAKSMIECDVKLLKTALERTKTCL